MTEHKDRIPTYPNRKLITPESGDPFYATVEWADEPINEGNPLNKTVQDEFLAASGTVTGDGVTMALAQEGFNLQDGAMVRFKLNTDMGENATLNVTSTGELPLVSINGLPFDGGSSVGTWLSVVYSSTLAAWVIQGGTNLSNIAKKIQLVESNVALNALSLQAHSTVEVASKNIFGNIPSSVQLSSNAINAQYDEALSLLTASISSGDQIIYLANAVLFSVGDEITIQDSTHKIEKTITNVLNCAVTLDSTVAYAFEPSSAIVYRSCRGSINISNFDIGSGVSAEGAYSIYTSYPTAYGVFVNPTEEYIYFMKHDLTSGWRLAKHTFAFPGDTLNGASVSGYFSDYTTIPINHEVTGFYFNPDGTKVYLMDRTASILFQYSLSTPWSLSGVAYDNVYYDFSSQFSDAQIVSFSHDGSKMYVRPGSSKVYYQYTLSTPWDISTISYDNIYSPTMSSYTYGISFNPQGTVMWTADGSNDYIQQYTLSTPWDISTISYDTYWDYTYFYDMRGFYATKDCRRFFVVTGDSSHSYLRDFTFGYTSTEITSFDMRLEIDTKGTDVDSVVDVLELTNYDLLSSIDSYVSIVDSDDPESYQELIIDPELTYSYDVYTVITHLGGVASSANKVTLKHTYTKNSSTTSSFMTKEYGGVL